MLQPASYGLERKVVVVDHPLDEVVVSDADTIPVAAEGGGPVAAVGKVVLCQRESLPPHPD